MAFVSARKLRTAILAAACVYSLSIAIPARVIADEPAAEAGAAAGEAAEGESKTLLSTIRQGGLVMIPLLGCSFLLTVFLFERAISLRRGRVVPGPFVKRFLHQLRDGQLDREQALGLCEGNGSPVARVFAAAVRKWGRTTAEIDKAIDDAGVRVTNDLKRYMRVFNGIATVTPLLGLLGTVFGMMKSFSQIAASEGMARTEMLATGISEALVATATGLAIAIPALVLYWFFVSRVDRLVIEIDRLGQELVDVIASDGSGEALQAKSARRRTTPAAA